MTTSHSTGSYWLSPAYALLRRGVVDIGDRRVARRATRRPPPPLAVKVARLSTFRDTYERLGRALDLALTEEAGAAGERLCAQLEHDLPAMSDVQRQRALLPLCEWLIRVGRDEDARAYARGHRALLLGTTRGTNILSALPEPSLWPRTHLLPNGRTNLCLLQTQLDRGDLDASGLERLMRRDPRMTLRQPEALLLAHQAWLETDPERAQLALSAYFQCQGVAAPERVGDGIGGYRYRGAATVPSRDHTRPVVSVLMAAYNAEATAVHAVDSLLAQEFALLEVLIADDCSTDGTVALLRARYAHDPRVRLFRSRANQGPYNIRNALLQHARGDYIAYHDADDLALPSRISAQLRALRRHNADACFSNWVRVRPSGVVQVFRDQGVRRLSLISLLAKRDTIVGLGGFRAARFAADHEFQKRLSDSGRGRVVRVYSPEVLGLWSSQSLTQAAGSESLANGFRASPRRAYSDAVFRQRLLGRESYSDAQIDDVLRAHAVYVPPAGIDALA